ncbi:hypothetical protein EON63_22690 [archaeon]|nr:MAG: hypothetical protein EON63_22690 [archaeon]
MVGSNLLEQASLGDLHAMIDWMTRYQQTLKSIRCPVHNPKDPANPAVSRVSTTYLTPKACTVLETLPVICRLYVYGGSVGSKGGAAHHLYDHCIKVSAWIWLHGYESENVLYVCAR